MNKRTLVLLVLLVITAAGGVTYFWVNRPPPVATMAPFMVPENVRTAQRGGAPPVMFDSPKFAMTDQNGRPAEDKALSGKVWIADFIFTNCHGACPKVTARMVELQKDLNDPDIRFVSFSVDPERDDPKTLKEYGEKNNPGENRWLLLKPADREAVLHVAQRMAAVGRATTAHDSILHTDFFILVDPVGKVRGLYDSKSDKEIERLKADASMLAAQRAAETKRAPA